jgi:hypothetical protein
LVVQEPKKTELNDEELRGLVAIMAPLEVTVDQCRDYLIFSSLTSEMERAGRDVSAVTFESEEFVHARARMKKDRMAWKDLRNGGRFLYQSIKRLNRTPVQDIFKSLETRDEEIRSTISIRLILRKLIGEKLDSATVPGRDEKDREKA